jgi:polysaccharide export outer membrane protein
MKNPIVPFLLILSAALTQTLAGQSTGSAASNVLSPGDSIRIIVWRSPEMSGDFVVAPDGSISHPLYRTVKVAGLPMSTVEANLARFLASYQSNPQFVVEPLIRVAVSGEVTRPAVFALRPETSVAEAVARAGGLTGGGRADRVRLVRMGPGGAQRELYVNLRNPTDPLGSGPVRSGDLIVVDHRTSFFRDILLPVFGLAGSVASVVLLIRRY